MPKVSFILPAYKRRFLKEAIDSILAQTCRDFELVVVDDKSPEALYEVIKEYPWESLFETLSDGGRRWLVDGVPVRYYQNTENIGGEDLVAAWNHAMEYATGEWCVLASDDDIYFPSYLTEMLCLVEEYPQCDLFHARLAGIDAKGVWTNVCEQRVEFETQVQMVYARGICRMFQRAPDFLFRRSALDRIGGVVNFPLAWYSDDATWMLLAKNGCVHSKGILFGFRTSGENISSRCNDVELKLQAGEMFWLWFKDFYKTLSPTTSEDSFLMKNMLSMVRCAVDELSKAELAHVKSPFQWWKLLRGLNFPRRRTLSFVAARYPWLRLAKCFDFRRKIRSDE